MMMFDRHHPWKIALIGLMGMSVIGCQEVVGGRGDGGVEVVEKLNSGGLSERLRAVAIPVGDDLFMIPTGLDEDGCETFKPHSVNNPVKAAIYYRQADGTFGIARDPEVCRMVMTSIGYDDDGCEQFYAVPVNADLRIEQEVIYYKAADGSFSPRKPETSCS